MCAWYYHPGNPEGGIDDYPLSSTGNLTGNPCIHAERGIWLQSGNLPRDWGKPKMSCSYSIDEGVLSALHADTAAPNDPRRATWNTITGMICNENKVNFLIIKTFWCYQLTSKSSATLEQTQCIADQ